MAEAAKQSWVARAGTGFGGQLRVPGDKSISHRGLLLGAIAEGTTRIDGFLRSEDCLATLAALRALGVTVDDEGDHVSVHGVGLRGLSAPAAPLDLGNSGTAIRLLAGLLAGQSFDTALTGDASLCRRPMGRIADPLGQMGARVDTTDGCPPLTVHGGRALAGIDYRLPVASAQVKSALLLAALYADGDTQIRGSGASRDHTERMLLSMGAALDLEEDCITLHPGRRLEAMDLQVPGDLSSAAFFLLGAALAADAPLVIESVGINPTRLGILGILELMGARVEVSNHRMEGREPVADLLLARSALRGAEIPPSVVPLAIDEFPVVFVAAAVADGDTLVTGAEELRHKESDRIATMVAGLRALGADIEERPDGALIHGGKLHGGEIDSHGDHRVAMAFAMAALVADGPVRIRDTANVATSFPEFPGLAVQAGLTLEVTES